MIHFRLNILATTKKEHYKKFIQIYTSCINSNQMISLIIKIPMTQTNLN